MNHEIKGKESSPAPVLKPNERVCSEEFIVDYAVYYSDNGYSPKKQQEMPIFNRW